MKAALQIYLARKIRRWLTALESQIEQDSFSKFQSEPKNFVMDKPYRLIRPEFISMGDHVYLGPNSMLNCMTQYPSDVMHAPDEIEPKTYTPRIQIGNRVSATGGLQIASCNEVIVEDDVLFATNVHMTDAFHGYEHVDYAYKFQHLWKAGPIRIGRGSWIGQNVVIAPGVSIGEMCIVGANSVVNKDIPPYSIALGAPAVPIKRWDKGVSDWVPVASSLSSDVNKLANG